MVAEPPENSDAGVVAWSRLGDAAVAVGIAADRVVLTSEDNLIARRAIDNQVAIDVCRAVHEFQDGVGLYSQRCTIIYPKILYDIGWTGGRGKGAVGGDSSIEDQTIDVVIG